MPFVKIEMWEGRTDEQKEKLIMEVTEAFERAIGVSPEHVQVSISDIPRANWGIAGKQASKIDSYKTSVE